MLRQMSSASAPTDSPRGSIGHGTFRYRLDSDLTASEADYSTDDESSRAFYYHSYGANSSHHQCDPHDLMMLHYGSGGASGGAGGISAAASTTCCSHSQSCSRRDSMSTVASCSCNSAIFIENKVGGVVSGVGASSSSGVLLRRANSVKSANGTKSYSLPCSRRSSYGNNPNNNSSCACCKCCCCHGHCSNKDSECESRRSSWGIGGGGSVNTGGCCCSRTGSISGGSLNYSPPMLRGVNRPGVIGYRAMLGRGHLGVRTRPTLDKLRMKSRSLEEFQVNPQQSTSTASSSQQTPTTPAGTQSDGGVNNLQSSGGSGGSVGGVSGGAVGGGSPNNTQDGESGVFMSPPQISMTTIALRIPPMPAALRSSNNSVEQNVETSPGGPPTSHGASSAFPPPPPRTIEAVRVRRNIFARKQISLDFPLASYSNP